MAKILIAAIESGAKRLTNILADDHELHFSSTVEDVLDLAKEQTFDLLIVGVLFDYSRMYDLIRAAKAAPTLKSIPIMGFSDVHTEMTISSRDALETVMHIMGAGDYVDTQDMSDQEIVERIDACLHERKPVSRKVQPSELTPKGKRNSQEIRRWRNRLINVAVDKDPELAKFLLTCMQKAASSLDSKIPVERILATFCLDVEDFARRHHSSDVAVSILLVDEEGKNLISGAAPSLPAEYNRAIAKVPIAPNSGSCGTAAYLNESVFVTDIAKDPRWDNFRDVTLKHNLAACWSVPIFNESNQLVGTFAIYNHVPKQPDNNDLDLIGALSSVAGAILMQTHSHQTVNRAR
ncbi:MAG: GAF domain-containing protein [Cyanobacteria bacterium SZAS-4]|nr:GAF domain-containing protein [Cyanobacteria bacterium SZAS-4]